MSLLALARQRLAELSQRDVPKDCPSGTTAGQWDKGDTWDSRDTWEERNC